MKSAACFLHFVSTALCSTSVYSYLPWSDWLWDCLSHFVVYLNCTCGENHTMSLDEGVKKKDANIQNWTATLRSHTQVATGKPEGFLYFFLFSLMRQWSSVFNILHSFSTFSPLSWWTNVPVCPNSKPIVSPLLQADFWNERVMLHPAFLVHLTYPNWWAECRSVPLTGLQRHCLRGYIYTRGCQARGGGAQARLDSCQHFALGSIV